MSGTFADFQRLIHSDASSYRPKSVFVQQNFVLSITFVTETFMCRSAVKACDRSKSSSASSVQNEPKIVKLIGFGWNHVSLGEICRDVCDLDLVRSHSPWPKTCSAFFLSVEKLRIRVRKYVLFVSRWCTLVMPLINIFKSPSKQVKTWNEKI
jgi:hypothetical protein